MKGIWSKCELALYSRWRWFTLITPDSSTCHTPINLSWASNCIHKHSCKRIEEKISEKLWKQAINSCNRKKILTVPKLGGFGLIRKFRSRASICKKNNLKRSYKTQVMNKLSSNSNLFEIKIWTFRKYV